MNIFKNIFEIKYYHLHTSKITFYVTFFPHILLITELNILKIFQLKLLVSLTCTDKDKTVPDNKNNLSFDYRYFFK